MRAGRLRHRLELQQPVQTTTDGSTVTTWATLGTVWGAIEPVRAREALIAGQTLSETSTRVVLRYNSLTAQLTARSRIRHGGKVYNLQGDPSEVRTARREFEVMVENGVNDG